MGNKLPLFVFLFFLLLSFPWLAGAQDDVLEEGRDSNAGNTGVAITDSPLGADDSPGMSSSLQSGEQQESGDREAQEQEPSLDQPVLVDENTPLVDEPAMVERPVVKLRSLDKITARTSTFEAAVGSTVKFGSLYMKARTCRKATPMEEPESAAFLQIWEVTTEGEAEWVFSGWMFASSPGLSAMDHPIYDVWVLDCMEKKSKQDTTEKKEQEERGEGELSEDEVPSKPEGAE